jgi:starch phosphorylase
MEQEVKTAFYDRNASGIPTEWVARMRASMVSLTPMFSAYRSVGEYLEHYYAPAAEAYQARAADGGRAAKQLAGWLQRIEEAWSSVAIISRGVASREDPDTGKFWEITAVVRLGQLDPADVRVELFANNPGAAPSRESMAVETAAESNGTYTFKAEVPAVRNCSEYTVRVIPFHDGVCVPLETNRILWEK